MLEITKSNVNFQFNNNELSDCHLNRCSLFWHRVRQIIFCCLPFFNKSVSLQVGNFTVAIEKKSYQQWRLKNREWKEKLQALPVSSLYELSKYFSKKHWQVISVDQIKAYDMDRLTKEQLDDLFLITSVKNLQALPIDSLYKLSKYFFRNHWGMLSDDQMNAYDVDKITSKEQFDGIFDVSSIFCSSAKKSCEL